MFERFSLFPALFISVFVIATPTASQCNLGELQCCNAVVQVSDPLAVVPLGLLGITIQDQNALVGLNCLPISVGDGSPSCSDIPACCSGNSYSGLISLDCTVVSLESD
ncbi:Hydrophobin [Abortiporus biennis]